MLRNVSAPARFFSQVPHEIIRHPRLSSDAVRLLAWQLSLPEGADESLSRTARRASIGKSAFQRAKRELLAEGYLHEWRRQGARGRWRTVQLVSNVPLSAPEAEAVWQGGPAAPPADTPPVAGAPTDRPLGGQPPRENGEYTSHPPAYQPDSPLADAEALLLSLGDAEPRLVMPVCKARRWAPLAAQWLARNLAPEQIRHTLTDGLGKARSPLGALRWRLEHALPDAAPAAPAPPAPPAPRVAGMRECTGRHTQPRLFTPEADEHTCPSCLLAGHVTAPAPGPGLSTFRAARRAAAAAPRRCQVSSAS